MSRHHQGRRHRSPSSSGVGIGVNGNVNGNCAVFLSPATSCTTVSNVAAASAALRDRYMYPLAAYLNFFPGGIQYPCCTLDGITEAAAEVEAAAALVSSDIEKMFRSHSDKRGERWG